MESLKNSSNSIVNSTGSYQEKQACFVLPPKINSLGLATYFAGGKDYDMLGYSMPNIQLQLTVIFFITQAFHFVLKRIRFPAIISQILVNSMIFSFLSFGFLPVSLLKGFTDKCKPFISPCIQHVFELKCNHSLGNIIRYISYVLPEKEKLVTLMQIC